MVLTIIYELDRSSKAKPQINIKCHETGEEQLLQTGEGRQHN